MIAGLDSGVYDGGVYGCSGWNGWNGFFLVVISEESSVPRLMHPERQFPRNPCPGVTSCHAKRAYPE